MEIGDFLLHEAQQAERFHPPVDGRPEAVELALQRLLRDAATTSRFRRDEVEQLLLRRRQPFPARGPRQPQLAGERVGDPRLRRCRRQAHQSLDLALVRRGRVRLDAEGRREIRDQLVQLRAAVAAQCVQRR